MDCTTAIIAGVYGAIALTIFYVSYVIEELKLDQQVRNGHELQGVSNVRLRRLIESIIAETIRQPPFASAGWITTNTIDSSDIDNREALPLNGNHCNGNGGQFFESKKYQDLLATAVLNKIVNTHGNGRHSESSPDLTSSSVLDNNHNALNLNKTDESISSSSSVEPRSESSLTDPIRCINKDDVGNFYDDVANENIEADRESVLTDFISSHMVPLPQLSADPASEDDEDEEDFISVASSRDVTWEDNWLFKKKKSSKTSSSVGMLVPAPKEDIRALIGDKTTDEVSDLSEAGSDTDDSSLEMISASLDPLNDRLVNKHLIGGKNTKIVLDELVDRTSMISTTSLPDNVPPYTETKNEFVVSNDGLNESTTLKISVNNCNKAISNEAINSNVTKSILPSKAERLAKESQASEDDESIVPPPNDFTDDEKMRNLLAKFKEEQNNKTDSGDDNSSSLSPRSSISCALSAGIDRAVELDAYEGITDFCVEDEESLASEIDPSMAESSSRRPSVIEILAAIALGPMLAVSASDDRNMLTELELSSLMELNELAMAQLNAKTNEERRLGVIAEESFDSGPGDDRRIETIGDNEEADLLSSPKMVMEAIRDLVGKDAIKSITSEKSSIQIEEITEDTIETDELIENYDQLKLEEISNDSQLLKNNSATSSQNEKLVDEDLLERAVKEECNDIYDKNAATEVEQKATEEIISNDSKDAIKKTDEEVFDTEETFEIVSAEGAAKGDVVKRKTMGQCEEESQEETHVEKCEMRSELEIMTMEKSKSSEDLLNEIQISEIKFVGGLMSNDEEHCITMNSLSDDLGFEKIIPEDTSSISDESLHTIGSSSEYSEDLEADATSFFMDEQNNSVKAELSDDHKLQQLKEEIPESQQISQIKSERDKTRNEFILPPPTAFCDEQLRKPSEDCGTSETVQLAEAHISSEIVQDETTITSENSNNDEQERIVTVKETHIENICSEKKNEPVLEEDKENIKKNEAAELTTTKEVFPQSEKSEEPPDKQLIDETIPKTDVQTEIEAEQEKLDCISKNEECIQDEAVKNTENLDEKTTQPESLIIVEEHTASTIINEPTALKTLSAAKLNLPALDSAKSSEENASNEKTIEQKNASDYHQEISKTETNSGDVKMIEEAKITALETKGSAIEKLSEDISLKNPVDENGEAHSVEVTSNKQDIEILKEEVPENIPEVLESGDASIKIEFNLESRNEKTSKQQDSEKSSNEKSLEILKTESKTSVLQDDTSKPEIKDNPITENLFGEKTDELEMKKLNEDECPGSKNNEEKVAENQTLGHNQVLADAEAQVLNDPEEEKPNKSESETIESFAELKPEDIMMPEVEVSYGEIATESPEENSKLESIMKENLRHDTIKTDANEDTIKSTEGSQIEDSYSNEQLSQNLKTEKVPLKNVTGSCTKELQPTEVNPAPNTECLMRDNVKPEAISMELEVTASNNNELVGEHFAPELSRQPLKEKGGEVIAETNIVENKIEQEIVKSIDVNAIEAKPESEIPNSGQSSSKIDELTSISFAPLQTANTEAMSFLCINPTPTEECPKEQEEMEAVVVEDNKALEGEKLSEEELLKTSNTEEPITNTVDDEKRVDKECGLTPQPIFGQSFDKLEIEKKASDDETFKSSNPEEPQTADIASVEPFFVGTEDQNSGQQAADSESKGPTEKTLATATTDTDFVSGTQVINATVTEGLQPGSTVLNLCYTSSEERIEMCIVNNNEAQKTEDPIQESKNETKATEESLGTDLEENPNDGQTEMSKDDDITSMDENKTELADLEEAISFKAELSTELKTESLDSETAKHTSKASEIETIQAEPLIDLNIRVEEHIVNNNEAQKTEDPIQESKNETKATEESLGTDLEENPNDGQTEMPKDDDITSMDENKTELADLEEAISFKAELSTELKTECLDYETAKHTSEASEIEIIQAEPLIDVNIKVEKRIETSVFQAEEQICEENLPQTQKEDCTFDGPIAGKVDEIPNSQESLETSESTEEIKTDFSSGQNGSTDRKQESLNQQDEKDSKNVTETPASNPSEEEGEKMDIETLSILNNKTDDGNQVNIEKSKLTEAENATEHQIDIKKDNDKENLDKTSNENTSEVVDKDTDPLDQVNEKTILLEEPTQIIVEAVEQSSISKESGEVSAIQNTSTTKDVTEPDNEEKLHKCATLLKEEFSTTPKIEEEQTPVLNSEEISKISTETELGEVEKQLDGLESQSKAESEILVEIVNSGENVTITTEKVAEVHNLENESSENLTGSINTETEMPREQEKDHFDKKVEENEGYKLNESPSSEKQTENVEAERLEQHEFHTSKDILLEMKTDTIEMLPSNCEQILTEQNVEATHLENQDIGNASDEKVMGESDTNETNQSIGLDNEEQITLLSIEQRNDKILPQKTNAEEKQVEVTKKTSEIEALSNETNTCKVSKHFEDKSQEVASKSESLRSDSISSTGDILLDKTSEEASSIVQNLNSKESVIVSKNETVLSEEVDKTSASNFEVGGITRATDYTSEIPTYQIEDTNEDVVEPTTTDVVSNEIHIDTQNADIKPEVQNKEHLSEDVSKQSTISEEVVETITEVESEIVISETTDKPTETAKTTEEKFNETFTCGDLEMKVLHESSETEQIVTEERYETSAKESEQEEKSEKYDNTGNGVEKLMSEEPNSKRRQQFEAKVTLSADKIHNDDTIEKHPENHEGSSLLAETVNAKVSEPLNKTNDEVAEEQEEAVIPENIAVDLKCHESSYKDESVLAEETICMVGVSEKEILIKVEAGKGITEELNSEDRAREKGLPTELPVQNEIFTDIYKVHEEILTDSEFLKKKEKKSQEAIPNFQETSESKPMVEETEIKDEVKLSEEIICTDISQTEVLTDVVAGKEINEELNSESPAPDSQEQGLSPELPVKEKIVTDIENDPEEEKSQEPIARLEETSKCTQKLKETERNDEIRSAEESICGEKVAKTKILTEVVADKEITEELNSEGSSRDSQEHGLSAELPVERKILTGTGDVSEEEIKNSEEELESAQKSEERESKDITSVLHSNEALLPTEVGNIDDKNSESTFCAENMVVKDVEKSNSETSEENKLDNLEPKTDTENIEDTPIPKTDVQKLESESQEMILDINSLTLKTDDEKIKSILGVRDSNLKTDDEKIEEIPLTKATLIENSTDEKGIQEQNTENIHSISSNTQEDVLDSKKASDSDENATDSSNDIQKENCSQAETTISNDFESQKTADNIEDTKMSYCEKVSTDDESLPENINESFTTDSKQINEDEVASPNSSKDKTASTENIPDENAISGEETEASKSDESSFISEGFQSTSEKVQSEVVKPVLDDKPVISNAGEESNVFPISKELLLEENAISETNEVPTEIANVLQSEEMDDNKGAAAMKILTELQDSLDSKTKPVQVEELPVKALSGSKITSDQQIITETSTHETSPGSEINQIAVKEITQGETSINQPIDLELQRPSKVIENILVVDTARASEESNKASDETTTAEEPINDSKAIKEEDSLLDSSTVTILSEKHCIKKESAVEEERESQINDLKKVLISSQHIEDNSVLEEKLESLEVTGSKHTAIPEKEVLTPEIAEESKTTQEVATNLDVILEPAETVNSSEIIINAGTKSDEKNFGSIHPQEVSINLKDETVLEDSVVTEEISAVKTKAFPETDDQKISDESVSDLKEKLEREVDIASMEGKTNIKVSKFQDSEILEEEKSAEIGFVLDQKSLKEISSSEDIEGKIKYVEKTEAEASGFKTNVSDNIIESQEGQEHVMEAKYDPVQIEAANAVADNEVNQLSETNKPLVTAPLLSDEIQTQTASNEKSTPSENIINELSKHQEPIKDTENVKEEVSSIDITEITKAEVSTTLKKINDESNFEQHALIIEDAPNQASEVEAILDEIKNETLQSQELTTDFESVSNEIGLRNDSIALELSIVYDIEGTDSEESFKSAAEEGIPGETRIFLKTALSESRNETRTAKASEDVAMKESSDVNVITEISETTHNEAIKTENDLNECKPSEHSTNANELIVLVADNQSEEISINNEKFTNIKEELNPEASGDTKSVDSQKNSMNTKEETATAEPENKEETSNIEAMQTEDTFEPATGPENQVKAEEIKNQEISVAEAILTNIIVDKSLDKISTEVPVSVPTTVLEKQNELELTLTDIMSKNSKPQDEKDGYIKLNTDSKDISPIPVGVIRIEDKRESKELPKTLIIAEKPVDIIKTLSSLESSKDIPKSANEVLNEKIESSQVETITETSNTQTQSSESKDATVLSEEVQTQVEEKKENMVEKDKEEEKQELSSSITQERHAESIPNNALTELSRPQDSTTDLNDELKSSELEEVPNRTMIESSLAAKAENVSSEDSKLTEEITIESKTKETLSDSKDTPEVAEEVYTEKASLVKSLSTELIAEPLPSAETESTSKISEMQTEISKADKTIPIHGIDVAQISSEVNSATNEPKPKKVDEEIKIRSPTDSPEEHILKSDRADIAMAENKLSEAIIEQVSDVEEIPPIEALTATCKIITHPPLQPTESLIESAQYIYDKISDTNLESARDLNAPNLAEELRMADDRSDNKEASKAERVIPQSISCENRCFTPDPDLADQPIVSDSVATEQAYAQDPEQGNHISQAVKQHLFAEKCARKPNAKNSGSKFRNLTLRDMRFLAELEKRRKQRELIQNYLDSLDCIHTPSYLNEDLYLFESKCSIERSPYSLFIEPSDYCIVGADSTSPNAKTHFLKTNILFSDRISSESNGTDDSTTTVIDTFGSMESQSNSDSGEEFSQDDSTDRDSSATATTANNSILTTTNKATNQSHIYSPPPQPQPELRTESACSKLLETRTTGGNAEHVDDDPLKHLVPGSIAEREYKKWYNAVDMPNNPYSVEALRRRLSGGPDRALDLPNISPCIEEKPLNLCESPATEADSKGQERDYSRYSRDYYINDAKQASGTTKKSPTSPPQISSPTSTASSIEVIRNGFESRNSKDWTLSTPVRRSSSLKYPKQFRSSVIPKTHNDNDDDYDDDTTSQYSSQSLRTKSTHQRTSPSPSVLTHFEKQLLHKDLKRNSFRAISSTTKDFVLNPIFDQNEFFKDTKLSVRKDNLSDGDTADSGVDSCLNGVPGDGTRTNLIF